MGGSNIPLKGKLTHIKCQLGTIDFNVEALYVTPEEGTTLVLGQDVFNPDKVIRLGQNELLQYATFCYKGKITSIFFRSLRSQKPEQSNSADRAPIRHYEHLPMHA